MHTGFEQIAAAGGDQIASRFRKRCNVIKNLIICCIIENDKIMAPLTECLRKQSTVISWYNSDGIRKQAAVPF